MIRPLPASDAQESLREAEARMIRDSLHARYLPKSESGRLSAIHFQQLFVTPSYVVTGVMLQVSSSTSTSSFPLLEMTYNRTSRLLHAGVLCNRRMYLIENEKNKLRFNFENASSVIISKNREETPPPVPSSKLCSRRVGKERLSNDLLGWAPGWIEALFALERGALSKAFIAY